MNNNLLILKETDDFKYIGPLKLKKWKIETAARF